MPLALFFSWLSNLQMVVKVDDREETSGSWCFWGKDGEIPIWMSIKEIEPEAKELAATIAIKVPVFQADSTEVTAQLLISCNVADDEDHTFDRHIEPLTLSSSEIFNAAHQVRFSEPEKHDSDVLALRTVYTSQIYEIPLEMVCKFLEFLEANNFKMILEDVKVKRRSSGHLIIETLNFNEKFARFRFTARSFTELNSMEQQLKTTCVVNLWSQSRILTAAASLEDELELLLDNVNPFEYKIARAKTDILTYFL